MFEKLGNALRGVMKRIASAVFIDKNIIEQTAFELKRALLEADVDSKIVSELVEKIKKSDEKVKGLEKKEQLIKLIHDELVNILGKEKKSLEIKKPCKIMFLGLFGGGKTSSVAKLALYYSKLGYKTCMLGLDVHRPAAPEQLEQLAIKTRIHCYVDKKEKDALKIWKKFEEKAKKFDLIFIDTAGRSALDAELIEEIKKIYFEIKPSYTILIVPAEIGQAARAQAEGFAKACKIDGVIVTRTEGTAKGGGAIISCYETGAKVLFLGTGEKPEDIETFDPSAFVSRLLGMGDLQALLEKAKLAIEKPEEKAKKLEEGKFSMIDFYEQIKGMQSMGPLGKLVELIPGIGGMKIPQGMLETQESKLKKWKYLIDSMTKQEIESPELLEKETSRMQRIAKGSNTNVADVRELINQYKLIRDFAKKAKGMQDMPTSLKGLPFSQKQLRKLAKKFF